MIYSRFRPEGGYDYFEVEGEAALGDDLPHPKLVIAGGIGAASVESGRALPSRARWVGQGPEAKGFITPMESNKLLGKISLSGVTVPGCFGLLAFGAALGAGIFVGMRLRRRAR